MGDMTLVGFDEVFPEILTPLEKQIQREARGPIKCKHSHCQRYIEKIHNTWYHVDGSIKCKPTTAEPEDD